MNEFEQPVRTLRSALGVVLPARTRSSGVRRAVVRDAEDETELETLVRRLRAGRQPSPVEALTDGHLRALLSR